MKKLSKALKLLWKAYKRELELKAEIKLNNNIIEHGLEVTDNMRDTIESLHRKIESDEMIINELKEKIRKNGHIIQYRIQKYIPPYDMNPYSNGTKLSEEYFKHLVEDSKLKMMNELIEKGFIKMIECDDCTEIAIHLADDEID